MNLGCIDRTLATGETSLERPPPARYLVRRSHSSQNPQYFSYPRASDPLGSKRSVYACLRQGGGGVSRAISIALHPREKREDTRERSDGPVFFCVFFSSCIVVVPEGTSPRRRPRSRAIACVRAIRERVRDETILSAERDARGARGALGAPTRVRFFVTRARRDPSTSSRPPRSDARVVSEIRGQIFVFLLFPSFSFDRLRSSEGTPRRRGHPPSTFFNFFIVLVLFSRCRARERSIRSRTRVRHEPRVSSSPMGETPIRYPASRERRERASATTSRRETPTRDAEDSSTCIHAYVHRAIARRARAARSSSDRSTVGQHARSRGRDSTRIGRRARG